MHWYFEKNLKYYQCTESSERLSPIHQRGASWTIRSSVLDTVKHLPSCSKCVRAACTRGSRPPGAVARPPSFSRTRSVALPHGPRKPQHGRGLGRSPGRPRHPLRRSLPSMLGNEAAAALALEKTTGWRGRKILPSNNLDAPHPPHKMPSQIYEQQRRGGRGAVSRRRPRAGA